MNHDVFISYAEEDLAVAECLVASLEGKGVLCWFAPRDNILGAPFEEGIVEAIDQSSLFIIVLSRSSDASKYVRREVARAFSKDIPIFVYRIENFTASPGIAFYLDTVHWFKADERPLEKIPQFAGIVLENLRKRRVREIGTRLPAQPLFGRDEDMQKILEIVGRNSLAVIGIQGIGKSKFVSAVFEKLANNGASSFKTFFWKRFQQDDPPPFSSFGRSIIKELTQDQVGFDQLPVSDQVETVINILREKRALVVVDQFESAVDPRTLTPRDPGFARFLSALTHQDVGTARVLFTSWGAPKDDQGLSFPHYLLGGLDASFGVQLFAAIGGPGKGREGLFQELIGQLGGHPWAIEFLARNYSVAEIQQLMKEKILLVEEISEIARRIVSPVYNRLAPESQTALVAACVFFKPASRRTIEFTAGVENIFPALRDLRQRGLVIEVSEGLYDVHTLVREFVGRQTTREDRRQHHLRAAEFYRSSPCPPREIRTSINDVMPLLNAIEHLLAANEAEAAVALLLDGLHEDLYWWGHYLLLAALYQQLLNHNISPKRRIVLHIQLGKVLRNLGLFEEAKRTYENALPFVGEAADRESEIGLYISLGDILYFLNDLDRAIEYHRLTEILLASNPNPILQSENAGDMANVLLSKEKYEEARQLYERAIALSQAGGSRISRIYEGIWNGGLANLYGELFSNSREAIHRDRAISYYLRAIEISKETKDFRHESHWKGVLGNLYRLLGEDELSEISLREALFISKKIGYRALRPQMKSLGDLFTKRIRTHMEGIDFRAALDVGRRFYQTAVEIGIAELELLAERQFDELKPFSKIIVPPPNDRVEQTDSKTYSDLGAVCILWERRTGMKKYFQLAVDAYTNAIAESADDSIAPLIEDRATAYSLLGKIEEAIADYGEVLRRSPHNSGASLSRAEVQIWAGRYDESRQALEAMQLWLKTASERVVRAWLMCHCLNLMNLDFSAHQKFLEDMAKERVELTYGVRDIEPYLQQLDPTKFSETQIQNAWMIQNLIVKFVSPGPGP